MGEILTREFLMDELPNLTPDAILAHDAALRAALETERLRLAGCGMAAMSNTDASRKGRLGPDSPYYSASYADVCAAVDREMALRAALTEAERERDAQTEIARAVLRTAEELGAKLDEAQRERDEAEAALAAFDAAVRGES